MDVVVVESPAKAKTINKYLGGNYVVLASYGHVRDLPAKNGSVLPEDDFAMTYESDPGSAEHLKAIADAVKKADHLYLATDPDREGEAISWHVLEALREDFKIDGIDAQRVVFNQITKRAVLDGINNPRSLDTNASITELLRVCGLGEAACAVEVNRILVPKRQHDDRRERWGAPEAPNAESDV